MVGNPTKWSDDANQVLGTNDAARVAGAAGAVQAQGTVRGMERGAAQGERDAGPVGAVVGGTVGAVGGILGVEERPRFREYVIRERHSSYRYDNGFRVGAVLPESGVVYYDVPAEYHVTGYRYTYVNDRAVLVDPRTRQIVEIID
jgi:hypothetical protein